MPIPSVTISSNGLTTISDGTNVILLKDMLDGGGAVDQVVMASQANAQIYGGTIGDAETLLTGEWGDPHVKNHDYKGAANTALKQALEALQADAADGTINNMAGLNSVMSMLKNPSSAGVGGTTHQIMDLQADHVLVNGSMSIAVDVEAINANVAFAENARITFADGSEQTITNIWNRTGHDGAIGARNSQAGDGGQSMGTFTVASADAIGHLESSAIFGQAWGSVGKYVLGIDGTFNPQYGEIGGLFSRDSVVAYWGYGTLPFEDRYNSVGSALVDRYNSLGLALALESSRREEDR